MVLLEAGKLAHKKFLSIWKLPELRGIEVAPDHVTLGALTTYTDVRRNATLAREFPLLARAAAETGSIATQNRGTLGGNIANASPAADSPPALLVYDAELEIVSARGARWSRYHGFHSGYKKMDLRDDELIRRIRLPRAQARLEAVLPQSGHAARAGDFESVLRRRRAGRRGPRDRRAHRARQRRAHRRARDRNRKAAARRAPVAGGSARRRRKCSRTKSARSTTCAPRRAIAAASRRICSPNSSRCCPSRRDAKSSFAADSRHRSSRSDRARQARHHARRRARGSDSHSRRRDRRDRGVR